MENVEKLNAQEGSKFGRVINALKGNRDVVIAGVIHNNYFPEKYEYRFSHEYDIIVAPKTGLLKRGLYTQKELDDFVSKLTPDLKPDRKVKEEPRRLFQYLGHPTTVSYDHLVPVYNEPISRVKTTTTDAIEIIEGTEPRAKTLVKEDAEEIKRDVRIRAFPDSKLAGEFLKKWTYGPQGTVEGITSYHPYIPGSGGW